MAVRIKLPVKPEPRTTTVGVALSKTELAQLDERRGVHARSEVIRLALIAAGLIGDGEDEDGQEG